jgi:hypothetical protein
VVSLKVGGRHRLARRSASARGRYDRSIGLSRRPSSKPFAAPRAIPIVPGSAKQSIASALLVELSILPMALPPEIV